MDAQSHRAGLAVSGAMHLALLAVLVFGFARAPKFDDASESIPVETITTTQLNEIMQGEKTGKPTPAAPAPKAEPAPPLPPERPVEEPPTPEPPTPEPPKRPEPPPPPKPEPPPPEPPKRPEPPKPVAEDAPSPPAKPRPPKPEETPRPPERPRPVKTEEPKPDKFKPDDIAKTLAKEKAEEKPHPKPPAFDPNAINKMLGQTKTADAKPNTAPPLGLANHNAPHMSVSLENALNDWLKNSYDNCWSRPPTKPLDQDYEFRVRVSFNADGSLASSPELLNPPNDPEWRAYSESVMRAVKRCNPLHVPAQFAPYYEQWRTKSIHFDSRDKEG